MKHYLTKISFYSDIRQPYPTLFNHNIVFTYLKMYETRKKYEFFIYYEKQTKITLSTSNNNFLNTIF